MKVVPGINVWRLVRTDRDGASQGEVADDVGEAMEWFLRPGQPGSISTQFNAPLEQTGENEFRIGAARPIQVLEVQQAGDPPPLPAGKLLGSRATASDDVLPTVKGAKPWWVLVKFWWRAEPTDIPYPSLTRNAILTRDQLVDSDWYLDRAVAQQAKEDDPGDETFFEDTSQNVADTVDDIGKGAESAIKIAAGVVAGAAVIYLISKVR